MLTKSCVPHPDGKCFRWHFWSRPLLNPPLFMWNMCQLHPLAEMYPLLPTLLQWPPKGLPDSSLSLLELLITESESEK